LTVLWLLALALIGVAVLATRTLGRRDASETRTPSPSVTVLATRLAPAAAPATPTTLVEERRLDLGTPTSVRTRAAPTVAQIRAAAATPTPRAAQATPSPTHLSAPTPLASVVVTAVVQPASTSPPVAQRSSAAVALTFDAGADRGYAEDILDRLAEEHVVASFGITGNWARANPDLVRRMAADGQLVFNHTLDHRSFTGLSDSLGGLSGAARRAELEQADAIIAPLIGHTTRPFFRLPYGDDDARVGADVGPDGYTRKIGWTVDSLGWRGLALQDIVARCLKLAAPGAVYVLHVGRASQDGPALPQLIAGLRERGFAFIRVDQL
jgi:peptidoglycan/xylan/chitin deacetylase (PgdA/CDA1 family)